MTDLHVHTLFSDGRNTPEEMVLAAIEKGLTTIGISDHSYISFDTGWFMEKEKIPEYRAEIARLKEKYRGRIEVLCGIEQDYWTEIPAVGYDYVIGSVHYVYKDGVHLPVDAAREIQVRAVNEHFSGDFYAYAEAYFELVGDVVRVTNADIIGHFDLVSKFNEDGTLFDEQHPRYRAAWQKAADRLLATGKTFEINTGAMFRGCRTQPYPNREMRAYLSERGARVIRNGDCHRTEAIAYAADAVID